MKNKFTSNIITLVVLGIIIAGLLTYVFALRVKALRVANADITLIQPTVESKNDICIEAEIVDNTDIVKNYVETEDPQELLLLIDECDSMLDSCKNFIDFTNSSGYAKNDVLIIDVLDLQKSFEQAKAFYQAKYDSITIANRYAQQEGEYPVATQVWILLKEQGFNDYVCAGIIGNMMIECGGGTLSLNYQAIGSKCYYGLCQWSKKYYPSVWGTSIEQQVDFLLSNLEATMNTFGKLYKKGFTYKDFLSLTDEREAAKAFAKCYERCRYGTYNNRKTCASIAYNYFV